MKLKQWIAGALCALPAWVLAQPSFPYNGVRPKEVTADAFVGATVWVDDQTRIDNAVLVIENGRVAAVGAGIKVPSNAVVHDARGLHIYPSFIDLHQEYGFPKAAPVEYGPRPQIESNRKGAYGWNQAIRADFRAAAVWSPNDDAARELRGLGFGSVLTHQMDGIARGTSSLVTLGMNANQALLREEAAAQYSFSKGSSTQQYPSSLMGSIALLRQTYYDAQWYASHGHTEERNLSLEAWNRIQGLPQIFDAGGKWNSLRADRIGDEFGVQYILRGNGDEYQRIEEIRATQASFILPVNFPAAWNVSDPYLARLVSLEEMKHWELAPSNAVFLRDAGVTFCFTSFGLEDKKQFPAMLRKVKERGLSENDILRALTTTPAKLVHSEKEIGALRPGMWANFFIASHPFLDSECVIYENWVQGERFEVNAFPDRSLAGSYDMLMQTRDPWKTTLQVEGKPGKYKVACVNEVEQTRENKETGVKEVKKISVRREVQLIQEGNAITLVIAEDSLVPAGKWRLAGTVENGDWRGRGQTGAGEWFEWTAVLQPDSAANVFPATPGPPVSSVSDLGKVIYPFAAYGNEALPSQETVHIVHATVWTNEKEGIIEDGEVLISGGKIVAVGKGLDASAYNNVREIDAKGKHVTPGIIDEHSHIALESVNEGTQASSAEVQEASVVFPEDINIYRQLSGGVTAAQLLHGSANPIGGQSALIKMRWGVSDRGMLIEGADGFIKFALGENVKQSNWGDNNTVRFPQSRMGVEQVYYDHFIRAREYGELWKKYRAIAARKGKNSPAVPAPRRDLELDALLEILESRRFITCHSYVQSEINMLMHVADSMGFRINTFTHILEGYKLADKMRLHGAGASSFSDWWAYKMEVKDAIPYNGALLWENGVIVAFNSDDAEMARRLNQEAAKAVKYGGVPEEEALKFVTLNPAKLLHIDDRTGSLKPGKDADVVVWSDHPLSIYARAEKTFVDGVCYYDSERDARMREWIVRERARLIQKMMEAKEAGEPVQQPSAKTPKHFHCETEGDR